MEFIIFFIELDVQNSRTAPSTVLIMYTYLPDHPRQTLRRVFK